MTDNAANSILRGRDAGYADLPETVAWLREHLWQLHMPNWEKRILLVLDAAEDFWNEP